MLVENGFVRVAFADGSEFTFTPSFKHVAELGHPGEIVQMFAELHGPKAHRAATYILAVFCDQEDPSTAIGWHDVDGAWHPGLIPAHEQAVLASHLMRHAIVGKAKPGEQAKQSQGRYAQEFHIGEYIAAARVHLGLSTQDAEALSMTEFQTMFAMKFPEAKESEPDVPSKEVYAEFMSKMKERKRG